MTYALIILDPVYDYLPGGSIPVPGATEVVLRVAKLTHEADLVIATRDAHPPGHFSFQDDPEFIDGSWPPHSVEGTKGARVFPAIRKHADYVLTKGKRRVPPDDYSAFSAKKLRPLEDLIDILGRHPVEELVICGFLFDIGVAYTAFDANAIGAWKVTVPLDCCGTIRTSAKGSALIDRMINAGINVIETYGDQQI